MKICKFYTQEFSAPTRKEAYWKACKWIAKYIVSKDKLKDSFIKIWTNENDSVIIDIYAGLEEDKFMKEFCERCKQFHKSFFINQEYNCSTCKVKAYKDQMDQKLLTKKVYRQQRLEYLE